MKPNHLECENCEAKSGEEQIGRERRDEGQRKRWEAKWKKGNGNEYMEVMYCTWHFNIIVCSRYLYLSFYVRQTGADAGNGTEALCKALEAENRSHLFRG